jgi:uncharacterized protein with von Willebrand factor type A (vWA) domain
MNRPSQHGKVDGATLVIIGLGLLVVLLVAIVIGGMDWSGSTAIPEKEHGRTEAELIEHTRKLQDTLAKVEEALIAASQPASALPADPKIEELMRQLNDQLDRANKLEARLERTLRSSTRPVTFPTLPETQPVSPVTAPADK